MILVLTDKDRDYGSDYLTHGLCALLGASNVVDFPRKPSLHWTAEPVMDCDLDLDTLALNQDEVETALHDGLFKLVVISTLRGVIPQRLYFWRELLRRNADRIVYCDAEDHAMNTVTVVTETMGFKPAAYFKRELPIGETWARPLPFGYPAERVVSVDQQRNGVAYTAHIWDWCGPDSLRVRLKTALHDFMAVHPSERLSVMADHGLHRCSLIAVSPSGRGYHSNRTLQMIADGCCPVIERPWMQWPEALVDGVECRYFRDEMDCVDIVQDLLNNPEQAHAMAKAAQQALIERHSTLCRAKTVWEAIHG